MILARDSFVKELRASGAALLDDTFIENLRFDSRAVFLTDPDGTLIERVQQPGP